MSNLRTRMVLVSAILVAACMGASLGHNPANAQATLAPLQADAIGKALLGTRLAGEYPSGRQWAEQINSDGSTIYVEDGKISAGRTTINGPIICFTYEREPLQGGCFEVWRRSDNCFDFYASDSDASLDDRRFGQGWSARGWYSNKPATCVSDQIT